MRQDDLVRVRHMIEAANDVVSFAAGRGRKDLKSD
jgi:hypothetical protein